MSKKQPQKHKSSAEVEADFKQKQEVQRQRDIVANKAYPLLLKFSKNIADANIFLQTAKMAIEQAFTNQKRIQTLGDLKVIENTDDKAERVNEFREFLEVFRGETVLTSTQLIEGLGNAVDAFMRQEMTTRPLATLKTDFLPVEEVKKDGTV